MRRIDRTSQFKRDYKRELKGQYRDTLETDLASIITLLANDIPLPWKNRDHSLGGNWKDCRDCHIKPDLVLIYSKTDNILSLMRLGSHSELSLS